MTDPLKSGQHLLTDEIIEQNFTPEYGYVESDSILGVSEIDLGYSRQDLRGAYDLGYKQALKNQHDLMIGVKRRQAMRPQQQQQEDS